MAGGLSVSNIVNMYRHISLLLSAALAIVQAEDDLSEVSDPRLFFANVTSSELVMLLIRISQ